MAIPLRRASMPEVRGIRPFAISAADFGFAGADANHDGEVSFGEYAAHRLKMLRAGFVALDADGDGALSPKDYRAAYRIEFRGPHPDSATFQELDRNRDGKVAWDEFLA